MVMMIRTVPAVVGVILVRMRLLRLMVTKAVGTGASHAPTSRAAEMMMVVVGILKVTMTLLEGMMRALWPKAQDASR